MSDLSSGSVNQARAEERQRHLESIQHPGDLCQRLRELKHHVNRCRGPEVGLCRTLVRPSGASRTIDTRT